MNGKKNNGTQLLKAGTALLVLFGAWTWLIQVVDVQSVGQNATTVGFATLNQWFHQVTGVHWMLYTVTDWLGLVPLFVCIGFGMVGFVQLIRRKSLFKVDSDILLLGLYYLLVIVGYLVFEMIPINYRPVLIDGRLEASYPSSTTLLVLSVMPTLTFQIQCRVTSNVTKRWICTLTMGFSVFMVVGRLLSGVHWLKDIVGAMLLSGGLFWLYKGAVLYLGNCKETKSGK